MIKRKQIAGLLVLITMTGVACKKEAVITTLPPGTETTQTQVLSGPIVTRPLNVWNLLASPDQSGIPMANPVFNIDNKAFLILRYYSQLWEFDALTKTWTNKGSLPFSVAQGAVTFHIGNKGYCYATAHHFWEYDPSTNQWTAKKDFPGIERVGAVAFGINNKGYMGTGNQYSTMYEPNNALGDFWEYDPATNAWAKKAALPVPRGAAIGLTIDNKGYIGTGERFTVLGKVTKHDLYNDWWQYDPATNTWTQKANYPGAGRLCLTGFTIDNEPYIGNGLNALPTFVNDFWKYQPATDQWTKVANYPNIGNSTCMSAFTIGSHGYIVYENLAQCWKYSK